MRTAREVAEQLAFSLGMGRDANAIGLAAAAIEQDRREVVEACAKLIRRHEGGDILDAEVRSLAGTPRGDE